MFNPYFSANFVENDDFLLKEETFAEIFEKNRRKIVTLVFETNPNHYNGKN